MPLEKAYYEQGSGLYISVIPDQQSIDTLMPLYVKGVGLAPIQWHVTVNYDPTSQVDPHELSHLFPISGCDLHYDAVAGDVVTWDGKNDKLWRVLLLDSPDLQELHAHLRSVFGIKSTYHEYRPHMSLVEDAKWKEPPSSILKGTKLRFGGLRFESLS